MTNDKAIERLKAFQDYLCGGNPIWDVDECREAFDIALAAMEQQWIPVTESLPGYGEDVLLSINGVCSVGYCVATNGVGVDWYYDGWYHPENDVDAWMPLPEPWKGEEG